MTKEFVLDCSDYRNSGQIIKNICEIKTKKRINLKQAITSYIEKNGRVLLVLNKFNFFSNKSPLLFQIQQDLGEKFIIVTDEKINIFNYLIEYKNKNNLDINNNILKKISEIVVSYYNSDLDVAVYAVRQYIEQRNSKDTSIPVTEERVCHYANDIKFFETLNKISQNEKIVLGCVYLALDKSHYPAYTTYDEVYEKYKNFPGTNLSRIRVIQILQYLRKVGLVKTKLGSRKHLIGYPVTNYPEIVSKTIGEEYCL